MKKLLVVTITIIFFISPVFAQILTGEIKYDVGSARQEVFQTKSRNANSNLIKNNLYDKNHRENIFSLLKGVTELKDRTLGYFSDGSYGVIYNENPLEVFYYGQDGFLTYYEQKQSLEYPYVTYKYTAGGLPVNRTLRVSEGETYIFTMDEKLIAHWFGENCYDENNNIIMTRRVLK